MTNYRRIGLANIDIVPWGNVKAATSGPTRTQVASALTGGYVAGASTVNNSITWDVALMPGTWTVTVTYAKGSNVGVMTASLDGVDFAGTYDGYAAAPAYNFAAQWTGISVTTGGVKEFKLRADSKNASSSAYYIAPQLITFTNTDNPTQTFTVAGPGKIDIIPFGNWAYNVNTPSRSTDSAALNGGYVGHSGSTSELGWYVPLTKGTWTLDLIYKTNPDSPISVVSLDGTTVATIDMYAASSVWNVVSSTTGISIPKSKFVFLKFIQTTKNASSSGYILRLTHISFRRTA